MPQAAPKVDRNWHAVCMLSPKATTCFDCFVPLWRQPPGGVCQTEHHHPPLIFAMRSSLCRGQLIAGFQSPGGERVPIIRYSCRTCATCASATATGMQRTN